MKARTLFRNIEGLSRSEITPRKRKLITVVRNKEDHIRQLKKICRERGNTINNLQDIDQSPIVEQLFKGMTVQGVDLMLSQVRCARKAPKGRRWTLDEKVMCLALFKRSPKCYALLRKFLALPNRRTLTTLLEKVPFHTGINEHLFAHIGQCISTLKPEERVCVLTFDEMGIREHISFDRVQDRFLGFEDLGNNVQVSGKPANHALVLQAHSIAGLRSWWKQPLAFYFSNGGVNSEQLRFILGDVLDAMNRNSVDVAATVSDMGTANVKCVNELGANAIKPWFERNGKIIIHIFDLPHLLKRIRSMFQKYRVSLNVKLGDEKVPMEAKWDHIKEAYEIDQRAGPMKLRSLWKLKDYHLEPTVQKLMKVIYAAQVLSHSVAAYLYTLCSRAMVLDVSALATAKFVKQMDKIFDSMNGGKAESGPDGKELRCRVSLQDGSPHLSYWQRAVNKVRGWTFIRSRFSNARPPCQVGMIHTLRGFQKLWYQLKNRGLNHFISRRVNQDPLENLFGQIRSSCGNNENPTVPQFISGLKTQIINGLTNQGLQGTNCEDDGSEALTNLRNFLETPDDKAENIQGGEISGNVSNIQRNNNSHDLADSMAADIAANASDPNSPAILSVAYVAGYIAKRLFLNISCDLCQKALITDATLPCNDFISFKEFSKQHKHLTYPSEHLVVTVGEAFTLLELELPKLHQATGVSIKAIRYMEQNVDFSWISCPDHNTLFKQGILLAVVRIGIPWYCTRFNRDIKKKADSKATKRKLKKLRHQ